jgi:hypothetical protein
MALGVVGLGWGGARADYVNPPGWDGDTDFTHQTWEFTTDDVPLIADDGYSNPFGDPTMTEVYLCNPEEMFWVWEPMGGGTRYGHWGGMPFGAVGPDEVAAAITFEIPNAARPEPWFKEMWIQVAYWGDILSGGQVLTVEIARDSEFQDLYLTYDAVAADIEDQSATGSGSSGQFWRFTHTFVLEDQPGIEYVRVSLVPADSMAVFLDQVSIDTRCVSGPVTGDFDGDEDVDLVDYAWFQRCFTGSGVTPTPECQVCDLDEDEDVDLTDFFSFQSNLNGPGN